MKITTIAIGIISIVIGIFSIYIFTLLYITWPISKATIAQSGAFGDSFGALTSLFSGLAFAGIIITVLLQKKQLDEHKNEISKGTKLSAITTLLNAYKMQLIELQTEIANRDEPAQSLINKKESLELQITNITRELKEMLGEIGVNLHE